MWTLGASVALALAADLAAVAADAFFEAETKAAYLFNFARFTDWPTGEVRDEIRLGVLDLREYRRPLAFFESKTIGGKKFRVIELSGTNKIQHCHMVFLNGADAKRIKRFLHAVKDEPILTIGEDRSFVREGGILAMLTSRNTISLLACITHARRQNVSVGSRLLELCETWLPDPKPDPRKAAQ